MSVNASCANVTSEDESWQDMLGWVNDRLQSQFSKIEELCTGAAYCQLMDMLFPNSVPLNRVQFHTNLEDEFIENFEILEAVFKKLSVDKIIPIDKLIEGRFEDNFEFLQWFKLFFDAHFDGMDYDAIGVRKGAPMGFGSDPSAAMAKPLVSKVLPRMSGGMLQCPTNLAETVKKLDASKAAGTQKMDESSASSQVQTLSKTLEDLERERDIYFSKLRDIEILCQDAKQGMNTSLVKKIFAILYVTADGYVPPDGALSGTEDGLAPPDDELPEDEEN